MICVSSQWVEKLFQYCDEQFPKEACGAIFGETSERQLNVHRIQWMTNVSQNPRQQFLFHPAELAKLVYDNLNNSSEGQWLGIFHSHPSSDPVPSSEDLQMPWNLATYWIISLKNRQQPTLKAYELPHLEQKLVIT